jgi:hypothetical protein
LAEALLLCISFTVLGTALVQRLRQLSVACDRSSAATVEELALHQRITEGVIMASLDVDSVVAEIEYERAQILGTRDVLSSARDRKMNFTVYGEHRGRHGIGHSHQRHAVHAVGVGGGAAGVILSIVGLRVQGGRASLGIAPNMLAPQFSQLHDTEEVKW